MVLSYGATTGLPEHANLLPNMNVIVVFPEGVRGMQTLVERYQPNDLALGSCGLPGNQHTNCAVRVCRR